MHDSTGASPSDQYLVRHRNPIGKGFLIVSKLLLLGYAHVSDGAKLTYWVIYDHDWLQATTGERKGYAFPALARLAQLRHATVRTIQRHLAELIAAKLLTRVFRKGQPSILYIEEPSDEQARLVAPPSRGAPARGDTNVGGVVTEVSPLEAEKEKQDKPVNAVSTPVAEQTRTRVTTQPSAIGALLAKRPREPRRSDRRAWLAEEMVMATGDRASLGCYLRLAQSCPDDVIFEALSLLKDARREGRIKQRRGALFLGIVRRLCDERQLGDPLAYSNTRRPRREPVPTNSPGVRVGRVRMNTAGTRLAGSGSGYGPDVQGQEMGGSGYQEGGQSAAARPTAPPRVTVTVQDAPDGV
jgi:hypothetical protein